MARASADMAYGRGGGHDGMEIGGEMWWKGSEMHGQFMMFILTSTAIRSWSSGLIYHRILG